MKIAKLWFAVVVGAGLLPATWASAQSADVSVQVGTDSYASTAPGAPVESVDVFYDQLAPYGVWVEDPVIGHVFIPDEEGYVPYTRGHWAYTTVGFVWIADDAWAEQTSHYGRWAFSQAYGRWTWLPDTEWGPAWVEWRQSGDDFGWAPLAPTVAVDVGYQPPVEAWHYCGADHLLDPHVTRYYEPRERVVAIHREARPLHHYATVGSVKVVVGPPAATLREHHVTVKPVKLDVKASGRVASVAEAHAQVTRAQARKPQIEEQNRTRIAAKPKISAVVAKQPARTEQKVAPTREPARTERTEEKKPTATPTPARQPAREPTRTEVKKPAPTPPRTEERKPAPAREPARTEERKPTPTPAREPARTEEKKPTPAPARTEEKKPTPVREPARTEEKKPTPVREPARTEERKPTPTPAREPAREPARTEQKAPTPAPAREPARTEEKKPAAPTHAEPNRPEKRDDRR